MKQKQIDSLISQMTIEEKLAQMTQLAPMFFGVSQDTDLTGPMEEFHLTQEDIKNIGSTLNYFGAENIIKLQKEYMKKQPSSHPFTVYGRRNLWI